MRQIKNFLNFYGFYWKTSPGEVSHYGEGGCPKEINAKFCKTLALKFKELGSIDRINRGGCAVAAVAMYRWVRETHPKELKHIRIIFRVVQFASEAKRNLHNNKTDSCAHAVLRYRRHGITKYIDTGGVELEKPSYFPGCTEVVVSEKLAICSCNNGSWRVDFDREKGLRKIEEIVGRYATKGINVTYNHEVAKCL